MLKRDLREHWDYLSSQTLTGIALAALNDANYDGYDPDVDDEYKHRMSKALLLKRIAALERRGGGQ